MTAGRAGAVVAVVAAMVAAAEALGQDEIIFPEVMAVATGMLAVPRRPWRVNSARMVTLIAAAAVGGLLVSRYVPGPVWAKAVLAFAIVQTALPFTGTTFAPMVSAAVLPVMLGTESWVYPVAATVLTLLIVLARRAFVRAGALEPEDFEPLPAPVRADAARIALRGAAGSLWTALAVAVGAPFCAAPPLLVAFTEFANPACPARRAPAATVLLIDACAVTGAVARGVASCLLGLPLFVAAVASALGALMLMRATGRFLPPAGALAFLPLLIPASALAVYPLCVLLGAAVLMVLALMLFREPRT